jgi:putative redox protein
MSQDIMPPQTADQAAVVATITGEGFTTEVKPAPPHHEHVITVDQAAAIDGGGGRGPNPFTYLYAALSGCVAQTIYSYVSRKGYPLERAMVEVFPTRKGHDPVSHIELRITLDGDGLSDEMRSRIFAVAVKCPVHRTLEGGVTIVDRG